jgi:hypothetical protein
VLWNARERRPRTPWRLLLGFVVLAIVSLVAGLALALVGGVSSLAAPAADVASPRLAPVAVTGLGSVLAVYLAGRFFDRRRFADFGLHLDRAFWVDLGFGLALGAALMTAIFLVELAAGWVVVTGVAAADAPGSAIAAGLALFVLVGVYEELLLRGYLLKNVLEGLAGFGPFDARAAAGIAAVLSSGVFGALHAGNPNATVVSTLAIGVAGLLFALAYLLTGRLGVPIGLHITWNFFQGTVYGFPVSGTAAGASVVAVEQVGPPRITGGSFGPEAGFVGLAAMLAGALAILAWVRARRGELALAPGVEDPDLRWR